MLAQQEFDRAKRYLESKVVSKEEYDQKRAALAVATAQVTQALQNVYQAWAALGLTAAPDLSAPHRGGGSPKWVFHER